MSLLLQALKKAEEAKRLREAAAAGPPGTELAEVLAAEPGSSLQLSDAAEKKEDTTVSAIEETGLLSLEEPEPLPPAAELSWEFVPLPSDELVVPAVVPEEEKADPVQPVPVPVLQAAEETEPEEDLAWLAPSPPPPEALLAPAAPTVSPPAPQIPVSPVPRVHHRSKLLPWLVLCGVLIIGGMGGYFWWQYQALSIPVTPAAAIAKAAPAVVMPVIADPLPVPAAVLPASSATALPAPPPKPFSNPVPDRFKDDAASVQERSGAPDGAGIRFNAQSTEAAVPLPLAMAYRSFQQGDYRAAEEGYKRMLQLDARNRDALLGMAALAMQRGAGSEAAHFYRQILLLYPRDEAAQAALYSLTPGNENSEAGLRQLSGQQADAAFALANLYAGQNRWSEAQGAYFQALSLDAGNADYAFNLAVSLEHLKESKTAARYYRQALAGKGSFDRTIAEARLLALESP
ncbi:tetratricopeptide repeat protein [Iodobacter ciconiae]|uniref:Tetratricopeptide repeat protein n=1 Tax=Iodobacter ciconiae TaxID=2496266 RepID=A0A3S8ZUQ8_9NEIS|nr:tetratricopeptide repeat protein [Iodobacter ciconiae]AZN37230.1 tetratricopeptide repeat protein [Iodobacter ciconiae]